MSDTFPVLRGRSAPLSLPGPHEPVPPPVELEPESFAARLYQAMAPLATQDPDVGWALLVLCNAIGTMYQLLEDLERDTPEGPGWSVLMDVENAPLLALGWLAQFVGVRLLPDATEADDRDRIKSTDGFKRGTADAIKGAARATLTGSQRLQFRERDHDPADTPDYAYYVTAYTLESETPDPAATLAAIMAQKPGGIIITYQTVTGQDYATLNTSFASYAAVQAAYVDYLAMTSDLPT